MWKSREGHFLLADYQVDANWYQMTQISPMWVLEFVKMKQLKNNYLSVIFFKKKHFSLFTFLTYSYS